MPYKNKIIKKCVGQLQIHVNQILYMQIAFYIFQT